MGNISICSAALCHLITDMKYDMIWSFHNKYTIQGHFPLCNITRCHVVIVPKCFNQKQPFCHNATGFHGSVNKGWNSQTVIEIPVISQWKQDVNPKKQIVVLDVWQGMLIMLCHSAGSCLKTPSCFWQQVVISGCHISSFGNLYAVRRAPVTLSLVYSAL